MAQAEANAQGHAAGHGHDSDHGHGPAQGQAQAEGQHHPIKIYLVIWGWLFILSTLSYLVDYFHLEGYLRWSLILIFMMLKAGLIVAVFMHMIWERLTLVYAILVPPLAVLVFVAIMAIESEHTEATRHLFLSVGPM
jgi:cytochrome c oxidase subunit IV